MPEPIDENAAIQRTQEVANLLTHRRDGNHDWQDQLDSNFLEGLFRIDVDQPYFLGPDGRRYFGFKLPTAGTYPMIQPKDPLDDMVDYGSGAAILDHNGNAVYVYSPGDVVAFKLYGKTRVRWQGGWAELPDSNEYSKGGGIKVGMPGPDMMPPLVARCADCYLTNWMKDNPQFTGRVPGVCLIRLASHTRPEEASDLVFNIFADDFPNNEGMAVELCASLLPRHLGQRVIVGKQKTFGNYPFVPLREFYEKLGLQAIWTQ